MNLLIIPSGGMGLDGITMSILNYYRRFDRVEISTTFIVTEVICEKCYFDIIVKEIELNGDKIVILNRSKNPTKYYQQLTDLMRTNSYDIVHVHGSSSILAIELFAAKICGIKVRIVHSHNTTCNHKVLNAILRPVFNILPTYRVACGKNAGEWLYGNKEFRIIKNGIDVIKYKYNKSVRDAMRFQLGLTWKKVVGHVGTFNDQKNHTFLIDIFKDLLTLSDDYRLVLIGDGEKRKEIENKATHLGINDKILFLGHRTDVPSLLQAMDVMVLPSLYEGLPVVSIEWQAAGLCTVVADTVTSEIELTDLIIFKSLNDTSINWARTIDSLTNHKRKSEDNSIKDAGYDINTNTETLISIYRELTNKGLLGGLT